MVRVDHAGELGADRIYAGQMAILGRTSVGPTIQVRYVRIRHVNFFIILFFPVSLSYSFLVDQDRALPNET